MVKVSLEVREGAGSFEVTARAESISEAVGARQRLPGREVRVLFPIDGDEFFGGEGTRPEPRPDRSG